jgi:hypothetical protein
VDHYEPRLHLVERPVTMRTRWEKSNAKTKVTHLRTYDSDSGGLYTLLVLW